MKKRAFNVLILLLGLSTHAFCSIQDSTKSVFDLTVGDTVEVIYQLVDIKEESYAINKLSVYLVDGQLYSKVEYNKNEVENGKWEYKGEGILNKEFIDYLKNIENNYSKPLNDNDINCFQSFTFLLFNSEELFMKKGAALTCELDKKLPSLIEGLITN